ncbi:hypothetical protein HG535_0H04090 [Zygotorulaspora mrakii]|uniref:Uncharacterized protein n=1 Tax=Zygotorulaspora mrakii TaxID=42260 RepID=A0A7H9BBE9_ZYGMR|nr:uncharacterized protein HG535_0H04090 [Zygotorulaspora mrakii]QLG75082.1 hypothetical protein HG535_0H04090 [Zygotorulaspora mrakii]
MSTTEKKDGSPQSVPIDSKDENESNVEEKPLKEKAKVYRKGVKHGRVHKRHLNSTLRSSKSKKFATTKGERPKTLGKNSERNHSKAVGEMNTFYSGAMVGSFLGATLSSAFTKFIVKRLQDH